MDPTSSLYNKNNIPSEKIFKEIGGFFDSHYPDYYPDQERSESLIYRNNMVELHRDMLNNFQLTYILLHERTSQQLLGLLELVHKEKTEEYVILMSRLILHPEYRGRGLSSLLHRDFIKHVDTIQTDKSLYVSLYMHKQNVYALDIYKHWGYTYLCDSKDGLKYILDMKIR